MNKNGRNEKYMILNSKQILTNVLLYMLTNIYNIFSMNKQSVYIMNISM